jgi:plasmid stabilization system protein ParE
MSAPFRLTPQATEGLDAIWWVIAEDNPAAPNESRWKLSPPATGLARHPRMGTKRQDITMLPVRFWTITKFPNYVIVYRPDTRPLAGGRHSAREARSGRGSGKASLMN